MPSKLLSHSATIFQVKDIAESIPYYRDVLGFSIEFLWQDPPSYAVIHREGINIHLTLRAKEVSVKDPIPGLYVFVHDINSLHMELVEKKAIIHNEIGNRDYGMRDFDVLDPDWNMITFGMSLDRLN